MFKVGEIVVYPRQGAGEVVARERKHILGEEHEYLTIKIFQSELTMLVRCDGVEAAGIRPVVAKQALQEIIEVLTGDVSEQDANWNRRFRAHQEQLKSSDPRELAGVIRNLARRQDEKGLSGGERQLLQRAKRLLASELQYARKTDEEEALAWIDDVLSPGRARPARLSAGPLASTSPGAKLVRGRGGRTSRPTRAADKGA